ncbi:coiled-coil domain-containing protein 55-domain containing protein [Absidia repens]|uniref:Coiled-coil domain-containing protein 55-domain containing protein n=1 Tax=Absidia repens TaxID=90262 RepID=A0A1X2J2M5_9FUNG|nr:coiled-coil domain-containing protein 55-domain containing protein [Absidia repens]
MKFGLNLSKKKPTPTTRPITKPASVFGLQDDDDDEVDDSTQPQSTKFNAKEQAKRERQKINQHIANSASTTLAHQKVKEAQDQALMDDPTIFDYDAVYDDLKEAENQQKKASKAAADKDNKKAKYIQNLLEMADIRKKDRLLAEEKKVAREREAEGDEFADKDVFLTESYKKQKAELERIEAEERQREEEAAKKSTLTSFYKQVLDKKDMEHRALLMATKSQKKTDDARRAVRHGDNDNNDKAMVEEARRKGAQVNDNNEVVDKRDLLGAGLNVAPPKTSSRFGTFGSLASSDARIRERQEEYDAYKQKKVAEYNARRKGHSKDDDRERERLSKEIERQMVDTKRKAESEQEEKQAALQQAAAARRTTDDSAQSARERYLARKKLKTSTPEKK